MQPQKVSPTRKTMVRILDSGGNPIPPKELPEGEEREQVWYNPELLAKDIRLAKWHVENVPGKMRWVGMLRRLHQDSLLVCGQAERTNTNDPRTPALVFLTMQAASLLHGGKGMALAVDMTDEEVQTYGKAVPYVQLCCICEILRRNDILQCFTPQSDILAVDESSIAAEIEKIGLTDDGRNRAYELYAQRQKEQQEAALKRYLPQKN